MHGKICNSGARAGARGLAHMPLVHSGASLGKIENLGNQNTQILPPSYFCFADIALQNLLDVDIVKALCSSRHPFYMEIDFSLTIPFPPCPSHPVPIPFPRQNGHAEIRLKKL